MSIGLHSNLRLLFAYRFLAECFFIVPVMIPLFHAAGLTITQIMIVESIFHAIVLGWEIPSGYFADVLGRRTALVMGAALVAIGLATYAVATSFWLFCLAEAICGFGFAFKSGADSALLFDTLAASGEQDSYQGLEGKLQSWARWGTAVGSVCGGLIATQGLRLPFWLNAATGLLMLLVASALREPPRARPPAERPVAEIVAVVRHCLATPALRRLIALQAVLMASGVVGVWSYFLYESHLGLSVGVMGALFCLFQVICGLGGRLSRAATRRLSARSVLALALVSSLGFALLARKSSVALLWVPMLNGLFWNLATPVIFAEVNEQSNAATRATTLSVLGMGASATYLLLAPAFGAAVDAKGLPVGHALLAVLVAVIGGMLVLSYWRASPKRLNASP